MNSKEIINELAKKAGIDLSKDIIVHDERAYDRIFRDESLGLGESYMLGWWDTRDKTLDEIFYQVCKANLKNELMNMSYYAKIKFMLSWMYIYMFPVKTLEESKVVAIQHYDLDKEIYEAMLEPMVYSCAYFVNPDDSLKQAQINKMELIKQKLEIKPGMTVLDIGCGWGELAAYLGNDNVYVDAITISKEQYKYAKENFESDNVKFYLMDYREFKPEIQYDAIVSVGMFEHVNSNNYDEFMKIVYNLLKSGGRFLLHTIASNKTNIVCDKWITKYIFPNSSLPSLEQISNASQNYFVTEDLENFGYHYDRTLMCWYKNFDTKFDEINKKLKKPLTKEFYRMWTYYLLSCAGSFRARRIQLYQIVFAKEPFGIYRRPILQ